MSHGSDSERFVRKIVISLPGAVTVTDSTDKIAFLSFCLQFFQSTTSHARSEIDHEKLLAASWNVIKLHTVMREATSAVGARMGFLFQKPGTLDILQRISRTKVAHMPRPLLELSAIRKPGRTSSAGERASATELPSPNLKNLAALANNRSKQVSITARVYVAT
jgi:hypothetical protein